MNNLKETYNRIAEEWHKDHQQDDWWVEGTDKFASLLRQGASVLDVGCGGGTKSKYLIQKGLGVVGIDYSEKMIEIAKREVPKGTFLVCDLAEADQLDQQFDGIFLQAVLLHVPKAEVSDKIGILVRKLKAGGYLYIAVKEKRPGGVDEEIKTQNSYGYPFERFFSYYTIDEIESHVLRQGLEIVYSDVKPSGKDHWIQVIANIPRQK